MRQVGSLLTEPNVHSLQIGPPPVHTYLFFYDHAAPPHICLLCCPACLAFLLAVLVCAQVTYVLATRVSTDTLAGLPGMMLSQFEAGSEVGGVQSTLCGALQR